VTRTESQKVKELEQEIRAQAGQGNSETSRKYLRGGARPPTPKIVAFVDVNRDEFGVEPICTALHTAGVSVAPSTCCDTEARQPSRWACRDAVVGPALVALWEDSYRVYRAHKLRKAARRADHDVGRDQVTRLMRVAGIRGARRGKRVRTTKPDPGATRHPDLIKRRFTATAPKQLWVTDLTFVPTWAGWPTCAFSSTRSVG
jgi:putative transposase